MQSSDQRQPNPTINKSTPEFSLSHFTARHGLHPEVAQRIARIAPNIDKADALAELMK